MSFKLKDFVIYKKNKEFGGLLFSVEDSSESILRLEGLVDMVAEKLSSGLDITEIKASILNDYNVTEKQLDIDLFNFKEQLKKLDFIEDDT